MLQLHRAERADVLVEALGDVLAQPPADPLEPELVSVPTRGVERWLTQRLSHRLGPSGGAGVCAHVRFPSPGELLAGAVACAVGIDPKDDPWVPERAAWHLAELIDAHAEEPRLAVLMGYVRAATAGTGGQVVGPLRRFAVARHLADLFDRYAVHRPELLSAWLAGAEAGPGRPEPALTEAGPTEAGPTEAGPTEADQTEAWQAELWRLLRARLDCPGPAERLAPACARLAAEPALLDLPARLSLFGLTRLASSHLEVLRAVAANREVHLFLLHPSGELWDRLAPVATGPGSGRPPARAADPTARMPVNPLLRSWGRDSREMQLVLAAGGMEVGVHHPLPAPSAATLLARIQDDVRSDRSPPGAPTEGAPDGRMAIGPDDRSVQVHSCHGRSRQVEVLRDAVLHLMAGDPTLEPRDVIVMCPDIESFAPLVRASFDPDAGPAGEGGGGALPGLRVRLADRSVRQTNPLLDVAATLLVMAGSRLGGSEVLDLAARPPVARRFGFDQDDLATLRRWADDTGVRWGLDAAGRRPWSLGHVPAGTWRTGLDRVLLGVAMAGDDLDLFGGALPLDDIPSGSVDLAGRASEFVSRLGRAVASLQGPHAMADWVTALTGAVETLAVADLDEAWQHEQMGRLLGEAGAESAGGRCRLSLREVRDLLDARLQGRPTRANFRTGDLTVCTLVPMRSVPHRVVALLGLDDGTFPRQPEADGDDLLLDEPRVGDRDGRSEDRQLLLDALLAATEHLIVTYSGHDERTNQALPPAVPVAELLDVVDATARPAEGGSRPAGAASPPRARDSLVVEHPLQPFDLRAFSADVGLTGTGPWSFDRVQLDGARALGAQQPALPWLAGDLPPLGEDVIQIDDLVSFVQFPARAFLRRRLGLYLRREDDEVPDALPLALDPLEKWGVGDRLLQNRLDGLDAARAEAAERARGQLPPGPLADGVLADVGGDVDALLHALAGLGFEPGPADSIEVRIELPDGRTVIGAVPGLRHGTVLVCNYSRLGAKHRLAAWLRFLALSAGRPEMGAPVVTVGRGHPRQGPSVSRFDALPGSAAAVAQEAGGLLAGVVALYDQGLRRPLPMACDTSAGWAEAARSGSVFSDCLARAKEKWDDGNFPGEQSEPEHERIWGRRAPITSLMAEPAGSGDPTAAGMAETDRNTGSSRFAALAAALWEPLLDHERKGPA